MKTLTAATAIVLAAGPALAQDQDRSGWPDSFTVATASQGGTYFTYGSGWANLVAEELGISGGGEVTGGPMQNMALVHTGDAAFGMTTMGPAADSVAGNNPVAPGLSMDNACAMFPMYQTTFLIIALADSGIDSIEAIPEGARVGFGPAGGTADTYLPQMLEMLGASFERRNGGYEDLTGQLQDGLVDVLAFAAGQPIPTVSQMEAQAELNVMGFGPDQQAQMLEAFPVTEYTIPAGTYQALEEDAKSVSMWNFAIANCDLPDSFVNEVVGVVMSDNERMQSVHSAAAETLPEHWDKNEDLPWHPGAAAWFEENAGADIPDDQVHGG